MDRRKLTMFGGLLVLCAGLIAYLAIASDGGGTLAQPADPSDQPEVSEAGHPIERVKIADKVFRLETVSTDLTRFKGLSDREEIKEDGGMLFVFPRNKIGVHEFVMRNCLVDIDIIFLDTKMRITATHAMKMEPPRRIDEPETGNPRTDRYAQRLKRYGSKFRSQFVIELKGGTLAKLSEDPEIAKQLQPGQVIPLDIRKLVRRAR